MIVEIACGVVLGLIVFRFLARLFEQVVDWWEDQHWGGKAVLLLILAGFVRHSRRKSRSAIRRKPTFEIDRMW